MAKPQPSDTGLSELKTALKQKTLGRLYFFHGEETFLLHHYLEQMKKQLHIKRHGQKDLHSMREHLYRLHPKGSTSVC